MNIDKAMEAFKGPKAVILPDQGQSFTYGEQRISALLKLAPGQYPHYKFSAVRFELAPGQNLDLMATRLAGRMLYCLEGNGTIYLNGKEFPFFEECFAHVGEGHYSEVKNTGTTPLQVFSFVFGPSLEGGAGIAEGAEPHVSINPATKASLGLLTREEAAALSDDARGVLSHQLPDTGPSFWQARPSAGWVEVKLAPFTHDVHHYALLMQTLYPGAAVREHAHNQLNEFFIITQGTARASLDGAEATCPKGSVIIIGRNVWHWWGNPGEVNAQNFAIIDPPGVEGALALTGRERRHDEPWPDDIERSPETGRILHERYGFVIKDGSADATA